MKKSNLATIGGVDKSKLDTITYISIVKGTKVSNLINDAMDLLIEKYTKRYYTNGQVRFKVSKNINRSDM